jgi:hypothetical protein
MKKNNLILILGGPERNMKERIKYSFTNFPVNEADVLFTGFEEEFTFFKKFIGKSFPEVKEVSFVHSHDTWTNVKNTRVFWQEYENIYCATEFFHGIRTMKLFQILGREDGIQMHYTGGKEASNAKLLCTLYSTRISAWGMSVIAKILRLLKK